MKHRFTIAFCTIGLILGGCARPAELFYEPWDTNNDMGIQPDELTPALYEGWDEDGNGSLNETEFITGIQTVNFAGRWDVNGSGTVEDDELHTGLADAGLYVPWDEDEDGILDFEEFDTIRARWTGDNAEPLLHTVIFPANFEVWDADGDGTLNEEEFSEAWEEAEIFGFMDADESGVLNQEELGTLRA